MRLNRKAFFIITLVLVAARISIGFAEKEDHAHSPNEPHQAPEKKEHEATTDSHDHDDEKEHKHADGEEAHEGDEHGEEEGGSVTGPDKGILEKGENGFKLAPEAIATFEMKTGTVTTSLQSLPKEVIVSIKDKKYVYRVRDGWIKRVRINDIKPGDQIVIAATGFVRTAEMVAEEGVAQGHSH